MIQNKLFRECLANVPEETKAEFELSYKVAERLSYVMRMKGMTQRELAEKLGKRESEISKWLSGRHNLTLHTIARIQLAIGENLIDIPPTFSPYSFNETSARIVADEGEEYK